MFKTTEDAVGPRGTATRMYGEQSEPASTQSAPSAWRDSVEGVDLRSVPIGTKVLVQTRNSRYCLVTLEGCRALVQGGRFFDQQTEVRIDGSTFGGTLLKIGWIGAGLFLEFSVRGRRKIVTSRVRSIRVEPLAS